MMEFGAKIAQKVKKINQQKEGRILRDSEGEKGERGRGSLLHFYPVLLTGWRHNSYSVEI